MAKEKQILQMHYEGYSQHDICAALRCGHSRVSGLLAAARKMNLKWEAVSELSDGDIVKMLLPPKPNMKQRYAEPDFEKLTKELSKPDVTRKLLWYEYCTNISDKMLTPLQYSQFCNLFDEHLQVTKATYRIVHEPGKRMFVDWAGSVGHITDAVTGVIYDVYIFVACLPYSAMIYAEGFIDMKQLSWTVAHIHALEYFGGAPAILVPDNTKTAVNRGPIYTTLINVRYDELAEHYGCAVIPARVRRPNDKALVENGVNIVEKSVLAAFRNDTFFSLTELNDAILHKVDDINDAPFQRRPGSRLDIFNDEEKEHLHSLPAAKFELAEFKSAKVAPDYHVQIESMRYSVPYTLIGKACEVRMGTVRVDVLYGKRVVATHKRLYGKKGQYSTLADHMPPAHAAYDPSWTPERYERWADSIGPNTRAVIDAILSSKIIVEQAFVPCMNVLGLAKRGRRELLEQACGTINVSEMTPTYSLIKNTMEALKAKHRLARTAYEDHSMSPDKLGDVGHVRGSDYYRGKEGDDDDI
jgi:transposase